MEYIQTITKESVLAFYKVRTSYAVETAQTLFHYPLFCNHGPLYVALQLQATFELNSMHTCYTCTHATQQGSRVVPPCFHSSHPAFILPTLLSFSPPCKELIAHFTVILFNIVATCLKSWGIMNTRAEIHYFCAWIS